MAEAAVENPAKFFCHQCSKEIQPDLTDFTCPTCMQGFIEELPESTDNNSRETDSSEDDSPGPNMFLPNLLFPHLSRVSSQNSSQSEGGRRRNIPFVAVHRRMPDEQPFHAILEQLFSNFSEIMPAQPGQDRTFRFLPTILHGNPRDYAWGASGLDNIITQLLNQLEGSGPPPADKAEIDALPTVTISQEDIDSNRECSVCMEDFVLDEKARELPCKHMYHTKCIEPWLEIHGTCPVCRKTLDGQSTAVEGTSQQSNPSSSSHMSPDSFMDNDYFD